MAVKNFVIDTNVILHDSNCIYNFENNNVLIPIVVLEEIDKFKKGDDLKNFQAREFIRRIDELYSDISFTEGARLGEGRGILKIAVGNDNSEIVKSYFMENIIDHRILAYAYNLIHKDKLENVIIVTKDINLRMKAKAVGVPAEDYKTGTIKNIDELYTGRRFLENVNINLIEKLYNPPFEININEFLIPENEVYPNEYFVLKSDKSSVLVKYDPFTKKIIRIDKPIAYGIKPKNAEQTFAMNALLDNNIPIVTLSGKAGTGKTLLALSCALERRSDYKQIYLARPVIPLGNKDIGYLPGDIKSKIDPYMQPLWDNLKVIKNQFNENDHNFTKVNEMLDQKKLVIEPLAYIRGRSLERIFFIVDEAQNLTPHEIKTIITRVGEKTKIVFTGDPYQIDTPYLDSKSNGLSYLIEKFKGQKIYASINLEKGERSELAELASNLL
ncbi:MAG: phosphate starvation-inducible protein PhoH [Spirochaetes bacterium GWD1_27_9]|nr:MAG: phosphate starvation-inducible protein PhoH [Spirochaetes bacterium GWB1_27_13]OHD25387.1 MAG: phosphate starvation-inducible protein PhoH [Spirochaetes bacterium GWC1_27_15]OHD30294.1 MAG: phosphate starvation-inducible protein PhoH [Spirochaetes bacterium GWD1_27_9]